jgi:hypothetical protein
MAASPDFSISLSPVLDRQNQVENWLENGKLLKDNANQPNM